MEPEITMYVFLGGLFATFVMDLWQISLNLLAKIPRPDWAALGRWVLGMSELGVVQLSLATLPKRDNEAFVGWVVHYLVGITYAALYFYLQKSLNIPALELAFISAVLSLLIPWCVVMPCTGYGFFASGTPKPIAVRMYNIMTHVVFFFALYLSNRILFPALS